LVSQRVERKDLKELNAPLRQPALRGSILWILLTVGSRRRDRFWGSWWCMPFFFVYGVLYGSSSDRAGMMRPRHRFSRPVDERRHLSDRQLPLMRNP